MTDRLALARLPTPLERLDRLSALLGVELWVKRDDLTGAELSGNKVRKLEFLLADAIARGADTVITCGGIQSNHARATAIAARRLGLAPVLLLRGTPPDAPDGNLLLDRLVGAEIVWCTPDDYRHRRDAIMAELADGLARRGRRAVVIPEGGSSGLGAHGYAAAAAEVAAQAPARFDAVVCAVGSGGTLAGLALGPDIGPIRGVAVCDDRAYFEARVRAIAADAAAFGLGPLPEPGARWSVVDGFQGPGYAVAHAPVWETIATCARLEGLIVDPVYTGKAMWALFEHARAGTWRGRVLFWHTGGLFGLFGRGAEVAAAGAA